MSWEKYVSIRCDRCGEVEMTDKRTVSEARGSNELRDWKTGWEEDVCPTCLAKE